MFCISGRTIFLFALLFTSCAKHYRVEGLVLRVNRQQRTALISHPAIRGYMPAMAMPFRVRKGAEIEGLRPGSRVRFQLTVKRRESFIDRIRAESAVIEDSDGPIRLQQPAEKIAIGSPVPDFTLSDQSGRPVRLSDFRGKVVAVNFIYTRCPLPDVCPRLAANFARLQKLFAGRMGVDLVLLSITIDPQYDTPEVLSKYAKIWGAKAAWHFLTGDVRIVEHAAARFGMIYWPEEGLLTHTSQTAVVGRDGKLVAEVEGSSYAANQLADLIKLELEGQ